MRKKILSMSIAAVLTAVTSSSVMAFDTSGDSATHDDGALYIQGDRPTEFSPAGTMPAAYQGNDLPFSDPLEDNPHAPKEASVGLRLAAEWVTEQDGNKERYSTFGRGDALIFPFFNQKDDWGTEFVVRNTSKFHAIVAKVAVYRSSDSLEVLDFNVYLSAADVVRFKIENGKLTSEDGSIVRTVPSPDSNLNDIDESDFASKERPFVRDVKDHADSGYVVVYGMAQAKDDDDDVDSHDSRYHKQHARLFANFRRELDICRPGWRIGHRNAMVHGTYIRKTIISSKADTSTNPITYDNIYSAIENYSIAAPNQAENCRPDDLIRAGNFFGDVGQHLTGTVRLYNGTNAPRDMILPAKAIRNFTWKNKILWTESEIASLADRRITGEDQTTHDDLKWARYNEDGIRQDAMAFGSVNTAYTFNKDSVANQLVITMPYKRVLVQLGNDDGYWRNTAVDYGTFSYIYNVFNEHEDMSNIPYRESPYNPGIPVGPNEVEIMRNLEKGTEFEHENGFALLKFVNDRGNNTRLPAIITQMIGSTVAGVPQVNWIYTPTDLFTYKDCPNPSSNAATEDSYRNEIICNGL